MKGDSMAKYTKEAVKEVVVKRTKHLQTRVDELEELIEEKEEALRLAKLEQDKSATKVETPPEDPDLYKELFGDE